MPRLPHLRKSVLGALVGVLDLDAECLQVVSNRVGTLVVAGLALVFPDRKNEVDHVLGDGDVSVGSVPQFETEDAAAELLERLDCVPEAAVVVGLGVVDVGVDSVHEVQ